MSFWNKLFGGGSAPAAPEAQSEEYQGFTITPTPQKAEGGFRIGAVVEKDGARHDLIRADVVSDYEAAVQASVAKAQQTIDQLGDRLFQM